jgi:hypothetical protein
MDQFSFWIQAIISILSGVAVIVPLVAKLVQFVQANVKEKNWNQMLKLVMNLMAEAEEKFTKGAEKKEWVLGELHAMAGTLNYDIEWDVVSDMIDKICDVSKELNK